MWEYLSKLLTAILPSLISSVGGAAVSSLLQPAQQAPTINIGGGGGTGGMPSGGSPGLAGAGTSSPGAMGLSTAPFMGGGPLAANNLNPGETAPTGTGGGFRTLPAGATRSQPPYSTL